MESYYRKFMLVATMALSVLASGCITFQRMGQPQDGETQYDQMFSVMASDTMLRHDSDYVIADWEELSATNGIPSTSGSNTFEDVTTFEDTLYIVAGSGINWLDGPLISSDLLGNLDIQALGEEISFISDSLVWSGTASTANELVNYQTMIAQGYAQTEGMLVSGFSELNGFYTEDGLYNGKPTYSNADGGVIKWSTNYSPVQQPAWYIRSNTVGNEPFYSTDTVATPDLVTTWETYEVDVLPAFVGTVTFSDTPSHLASGSKVSGTATDDLEIVNYQTMTNQNYLTAEADTLQSVTSRGATTTNALTFENSDGAQWLLNPTDGTIIKYIDAESAEVFSLGSDGIWDNASGLNVLGLNSSTLYAGASPTVEWDTRELKNGAWTVDTDATDGIEIVNYQTMTNHMASISTNVASHLLYVAKNGSDSTGTGTYLKPYLTIKYAMDSITDNDTTNRYSILVCPGRYTENNPIQMKSNTSLVCEGDQFTVRVEAMNASSNMLEMASFNKISGVSFYGVTNATVFNIDTPVGVVINECALSTCLRGIVCDDPIAQVTVNNLSALNYTSQGESLIDMRAGNARILNCVILPDSLHTDFIVLDSTNTSASIYGCDAQSDNLVTGLRIENGAIAFGVVGVIAENLIVVDPASTFAMLAMNNVEGDLGTRVYGELAVGTPESPAETVMGNGDSYTRGMLLYTYDGATYSNVTVAASSASGSTFGFPNVNVNTAMYLGSSRIGPDLDYLKHPGAKLSLVSPIDMGAGDVEFQYYTTNDVWEAFRYMVTDSNAPYESYADGMFGTAGSFQIRYDSKSMMADWKKNDPIGLGNSNYWARAVILSAITTSPVLQQVKLHTDRTEVNTEGFVEYFGQAEPLRRIVGASFEETIPLVGKTPVNENVKFGTVLELEYAGNRFINNATDGRGGIVTVPLGLDTSRTVTFEITFSLSSPASAANDVGLVFTYGYMDADVILDGTNPEITIANDVPVGATANVQYETSFTFPVNTLIPGDRIPFGFTRPNGDPYGGSIYIIDTRMTGTFWR